MNTIYRIVWNAASARWTVASECAKGRKKSTLRASVAGALLLAGMSLAHAGTAGTVTDSAGKTVIATTTTANLALAGYQRAISKRANITFGASASGNDTSVGVGVGMGF